jgi:HAD superfamily hydrolase (TIGR01509 family)
LSKSRKLPNGKGRNLIKAIIFDLDGTITAFNLDYKAVRAEARDLLMKAGIPASVLGLNESLFEMLKKTEIFMRNNRKPKQIMEETRANVLAIAEKHELAAARNTSLLPGVLMTLKTLKKMGLKIGLCTINGEMSTQYILRRFKITELFDAIVPRNRVKYVKPNREHLAAVLEALKVEPSEAMIVGDSEVDMKCSAELKAVAVGLPTGVSSQEELANSGANYVIATITDLPILIEKLNRPLEKRKI